MPTDPMVSVVIPTYNRAGFIKEAIDSVLAQTYSELELIVVDDGSIDETEKILLPYKNKIHLLKQENKGVSAARNLGIAQAKGEWVAFLDSDDLWKKDKLAKQMLWLRLHQQVLICHTDEIWSRGGERVHPLKKHAKPHGWIFEKCLPMCVVSPSSVVIHKSLFEKYGTFDESLPACEDYDLWLRFAAKVTFGFVPEKLLTKRGGREDQLSTQHWGLDRFRVQSLVKLIQSGVLKPAQLDLTKEMVRHKCAILAKGSRKRDKLEEEKKYLEIINENK